MLGTRPLARIAGLHIRIDRQRELMARAKLSHFDAIQSFAVLCVSLAPDGVRDAGLGHQIAFIGRINKFLAGEGLAALHGDGVIRVLSLFTPLFRSRRWPITTITFASAAISA